MRSKLALMLATGWLLAATGASADLPRTAATAGTKVYFISPKDGKTVHSPVKVRFGLAGMGVAPAGVMNPGTGHHHLIVDAPVPPMNLPIPKDANHLHFGGGQTEAVIELAPGPHTLQLVLADANHIPHDPPVVSELIHVTVK